MQKSAAIIWTTGAVPCSSGQVLGLLQAPLLKKGDNSSSKELAALVDELALLPLLPKGGQRRGLVELTCLSLQVERDVVISLPSSWVGEIPAQQKGA